LNSPHEPNPILDPKMPFQIVKILDKGVCLVNGISEITKCPDCDRFIRYGGSWSFNIFELFTDDQLDTLQLIQAEHGTKGANDYYGNIVSELVAAHPPNHQISQRIDKRSEDRKERNRINWGIMNSSLCKSSMRTLAKI
jgi:hypothetical protein